MISEEKGSERLTQIEKKRIYNKVYTSKNVRELWSQLLLGSEGKLYDET